MRGRKPSGPEYVERLENSAKAKARAKAILETMANRLTVQEACRRLGIGEVFFNRLRKRFLNGGVPALEDRPAGRRRRQPSAEAERIGKLEAELQQNAFGFTGRAASRRDRLDHAASVVET
jgi:hypothetical protein